MELTKTKGCVSFSLYGDSARYAYGALNNVAAVARHYPGWVCRVYLERGHYAERILREVGAEVVVMDPLPGSGGMFWRFLAADDLRFTHVVVRDADSLVGSRDALMTSEWVNSNKTLHVMRDNPWHRMKAVIGGAFGIMTGKLPMQELISTWSHNYQYGDDEEFLHQKVWSVLHPDGYVLVHDYEGINGEPIPPLKLGEDHVCQRRPINLQIPGKWKAVVLSGPRAEKRRAMFSDSLNSNGGFLQGKVDIRIGKPAAEYDIPADFEHRDTYPHYYAATQDHKKVWQNAIDEDLDYLFVFEDDAVFHTDFEDHLARTLMCVPKDWYAIQLGGQEWSDINRDWYAEGGVVRFPNALATVRGCLGMHGILWSRSGLIAALEYYQDFPTKTVDQVLANWQRSSDAFFAPARWIIGINPDTPQFGLA